ncbi:unnamed protein product [Paramecium octaurelia]|uniref:RING-type domain-containing protein n=1 Tax=Paramecium octaurelia TaxID=43137 RepID=A0A8S1WW65_PAROT|nr:unnamed protein product [Paramecium octaurelia]
MGYNKNASILCSLIHYAFNKQKSRILESILQLINTFKKQTIYTEFAKLIKQIKFDKNPVQKFFQNLFLIDQKNEIAGKILFDCCKSKDWLDGGQISYDQIANYFQMKISIQNCNEVYGIKFKETIDLMVDANQKFYFLISEPIIKIIEKNSCPQCKIKSEFILLTCNHKQCYKCLLKKPQTENIKCASCGKLSNKKHILHCLQNLEKVKEQNEINKLLLKYYDSANSQVVQVDQQLSLDRSGRHHANQDIEQKIAPTVEPLYECSLCSKKSYNQFLILDDCKHQFCYYCTHQYKIQKECPLQNCIKKMEQNQLQTCLNKNNPQNKDQSIINQNIKEINQNPSNPKVAEQCSRCSNIYKSKLFEVKKCNHKFCISCLSNIEMKYETSLCLKSICQSTFTKQEYKMYFKSVQQTSNSEVLQMQRALPSQNYSYFVCESCKYKRSEDQKYILNCGHPVCNACIIQNVQFKTTCCYLASLDSDYKQFRKNQAMNCKGCQFPYPIKELFQLNCKHEFCLSCCQKIYLGRPPRCLEKKCDRLIVLVDDLYNFILSKKIEQSKEIADKEEQKKNEEKEEQDQDQKLEKKENKQIKEEPKQIDNSLRLSILSQKTKTIEEQESLTLQKSVINLKENKINEQKKEELKLPSTKQQEGVTPNGQNSVQNDDQRKQEIYEFEDDIYGSDSNFEEEIIIYQQIQDIKSAQERENEVFTGSCTNCNSEFSPFNKKQLIDCKSHQIGACCILNTFINCPQCEQTSSNTKRIKQKLILPCNPVEEESVFESTILKPSLGSYYPQSFQQTYKGYSDQLQKFERYRNTQHSAIKRNVTTDTVNKRIQDNQQVLEDKSKYKNELAIQNELTLLRSSPPYVQQSYYPYRYDKLQYGEYDHRNRLELYSRDFNLNSKITTGYSGRLY